jgi:hypothetical protein
MRAIVHCAAVALIAGTALGDPASAQDLDIQLTLPDGVGKFLGQLLKPPGAATPSVPDAVPEATSDATSDAGSVASDIPADNQPGFVPEPPPVGYALAVRYNLLTVRGTNTDAFFYARQDIFLDATGDDPSHANMISQGGNFGPHPTGSSVPVTAGANYVLFPVCNRRLAWDSRRLARLAKDQTAGAVALSCQP